MEITPEQVQIGVSRGPSVDIVLQNLPRDVGLDEVGTHPLARLGVYHDFPIIAPERLDVTQGDNQLVVCP